MIVLSCLNQSFFHTLTDKNFWHYPVLMNLEGIPVTMTIFMIFTVIENSWWCEKCNQQIRLRLMFFSLFSKGLIESMEFKIKHWESHIMEKFTFSLFLVHFIFLTNLLGTDLSMEIQRVAFKQSKKISKIVIKEGACNSLNGHLINTCNLTKKPISQQKHIHNKKPLTLEYIQQLRSYISKGKDFSPWTGK